MELATEQIVPLYIVGQIQTIFFQNPANYYKVLLVKISETNADYREKEIVIVGSFGDIQENELYRFEGKLTEHPRYGLQFQAERYQQERPTSKNGIVAYLSGDKFPGIGPKTAEHIIDVLGEDAIDRIIQDPDVLQEVKGLNTKKRQQIVTTLRLNYGMEQVVIGLNQYGFGSQLAFAIYQEYKNEALEMIQENPYRLVEDIQGIGFKRADQLADQLGYAADSPQRIRAAILHDLLDTCLNSGNTYIEAEQLLKLVLKTLESSRPIEINPELVAEQIIQLAEEGKLLQEGTRIFEKTLYFSEWGIGTGIRRLLNSKDKPKYNAELVQKTIKLLEKRLNIQYGASQLEAIQAAIQSPLFILTGGPGTGKTTVVNGIVSLFAELNGLSLELSDYSQSNPFPILLAAPTGRAAKRLNELTGLPAGTIHRHLGLTGREKNIGLTSRELEGGLLIVDEMSMVDTWLANTLLKAVPAGMQVILVGDKDQLPSVGPGQVLHDLLTITDIPHKELSEIYRQGLTSSIIPLAHEIKNGRLPADFTKNQTDRSFFDCSTMQIEPVIRQVVTRACEKGFTPQEIQVLAPMYRGAAGINEINKMMQEIFNPNPDGSRKEVSWNDLIYRIGDKVLHLVNSPEINVFNGDMGVITGITLAKESEDKIDELVIEFDSGEVEYQRKDWNKITMAYCCSIHKSQGSEFKMVILPMVHAYRRMLQRNLLYTAITRSKDLLILLGEPEAFAECVYHKSADRQTMLPQRIQLADDMPIGTRLQLEAYESNQSEVEDDPSSVEMTSQSKKKSETNTSGAALERPKAPKASQATQGRTRVARTPTLFEQAESVPEVQQADVTISESPAADYQTTSMILTNELIEKQAIDPLIGMNTCTPADFSES